MASQRLRRVCAATAMAVAAASSPSVHGFVEDGGIRLKTQTVTLPVLEAQPEKAAAIEALARPGAARRIVVQFTEPVTPARRAALAQEGLVLLSYLGGNGYFATLAAAEQIDAPRLAAAPELRSLAAVERSWKIHPALLAGDVPPWTVVQNVDPQNPVVAVVVVFHRDAPMGVLTRDLAQQHGGAVVGELISAPVLVVELPLQNLAGLADEDLVQWIEPPLPALSDLALRNESNRARTGADVVRGEPYGLSGQGVTVFVYDGGTARETHQTFGGRLLRIDNTFRSTHATHVAGTIGGDGSASDDHRHRGMAPGVNLLSAGLGNGGALPQGFLYTNPMDLEQEYFLAVNTYGAHLANNSIGTNVESNGLNCAMQGDYSVTCNLIDQIARGSLGAPFRSIWAGGNERQGTRCDVEGFGRYYSTAPPAGAKNHITVGALNSNDDSMTWFSSWGPVDDGRMKPDISAPGCQVGGDNGVTSSGSGNDMAYVALCGTSMAAPTVAGLTALLLEDFRNHFPARPFPRTSTVKAILAHTALDLFNPGPDYKSGYGSVRIQPAVQLLRTGAFQEGQVGHGEVLKTELVVTGGSPLKVTLAWDDYPATPNAAVTLINDLDLRLVDPDGYVHYPWTLDPLNPEADAIRAGANRRDNLEQVYVDDPMPGSWVVEIVAFNVPEGPQPFSLAGAGATAGMIITPVQLPLAISASEPTPVQINIQTINQQLIGPVMLHVRSDDGQVHALPMEAVQGGLYRGDIPALTCGLNAHVHFSAEGSADGTVTLPQQAPTTTFEYLVGRPQIQFTDSFDTDRGWSVADQPVPGQMFTGSWERAVPVSAPGAPASDFDGDGWCFVTANQAGSGSGVAWGSTTLLSPRVNAAGPAPTVSYARWFTNSSTLEHTLRVEVSGDDGQTWHLLEEAGPGGPEAGGGWFAVNFPIPPEAATDQFRIRFTTSGSDSTTIVEAAVDQVQVHVRDCEAPPICLADFDGDGAVTSQDIGAFISAWVWSVQTGGLAADFNADGVVNSADMSAFISAWLAAVADGC